jgi:hypothetical protein
MLHVTVEDLRFYIEFFVGAVTSRHSFIAIAYSIGVIGGSDQGGAESNRAASAGRCRIARQARVRAAPDPHANQNRAQCGVMPRASDMRMGLILTLKHLKERSHEALAGAPSEP